MLSSVIHAFKSGDTPESIISAFPSLSLADVYTVIAYYLRHRTQIDQQIEQEQSHAIALRQALETQQPELFTLQNRLKSERTHATNY